MTTGGINNQYKLSIGDSLSSMVTAQLLLVLQMQMGHPWVSQNLPPTPAI